MSTKTEPYRKYVAHDEKSKSFIFFGKPRNVVWFFFSKYAFKGAKKKIRYGPTADQKHAKFID